MISVREVAIVGESAEGPFEGRVEFAAEGLQILSAPNAYGKSLIATSIAWCFGLEPMYGLRPGDPALFSEAVRDRVDLGGHRGVPVLRCEAQVVLAIGNGAKLRIARPIHWDSRVVKIETGGVHGNLTVGSGAMKDQVAGFQAHFFAWANLPTATVMNNRGQETPIYLENLAPLFVIDQMEGWSDVQAQQVYRYGQIEVGAAAFEYLLGMREALRRRRESQAAELASGARRMQARVLADEYRRIVADAGWVGELPTPRRLRELEHQWAEIDLLSLVKSEFHFDFLAERDQLQRRAVGLRRILQGAESDRRDDTAVAETSQRVVSIKEEQHRLNLELRTVRSQLAEQRSLLATTEARAESARDLLRLKKEGLGILPRAECPTCHQVVDPASLHLAEHGIATIETFVDAVRRDSELIRRSVERLEGRATELGMRSASLEHALDRANGALGMVQRAIGPQREAVLKAATDLLEIERELERNRRIVIKLDELQARIREWARVRSEADGDDSGGGVESNQRLLKFAQGFRENLIALEHGGVHEDEAGEVTLDESYVPYLGHRRLRSVGSASDRARLVMAYVLALLEVGEQHPGFCLLDEPIQQNPDPRHHEKLVRFFASRGRKIKRQVIVLTSLRREDIELISEVGLRPQVFEGKFLRPVKSTGGAGVEGV